MPPVLDKDYSECKAQIKCKVWSPEKYSKSMPWSHNHEVKKGIHSLQTLNFTLKLHSGH